MRRPAQRSMKRACRVARFQGSLDTSRRNARRSVPIAPARRVGYENLVGREALYRGGPAADAPVGFSGSAHQAGRGTGRGRGRPPHGTFESACRHGPSAHPNGCRAGDGCHHRSGDLGRDGGRRRACRSRGRFALPGVPRSKGRGAQAWAAGADRESTPCSRDK